jgi:hypothetical protein
MVAMKLRNEDVVKTPDIDVFASETDLALVQALVDDVGVDVVLNKVFGFDNKKPYRKGDGNWYDILECEHVNRQGKRVKGKRYMGVERTDLTWLRGAMASEAVKIAARDPDMLAELAAMR